MKKIFYYSSVLLATLLSTTSIKADVQTDVVEKSWNKPTLVYGSGLTNDQIEETNKLLKITNIDKVNRQVNSGEDFQKFLGKYITDDSLFSSVLVTKKEKEYGVNVNIVTPSNITSVTKTQYANAAITAGASNVEIDVASPVQVTGESALIGVYKALEANGQEIDTDRAEVASEELSTVNNISNEQALNEKFDSAALDLAMAQIKSELGEYKKQKSGVANAAKVADIVNKALEDNNLENVLTTDQVQSLISFAETYQTTSAIDSEEVANQLKVYTQNTVDSLSEKFKDLRNSEEAQGVFASVKLFFENLFRSFLGLFT